MGRLIKGARNVLSAIRCRGSGVANQRATRLSHVSTTAISNPSVGPLAPARLRQPSPIESILAKFRRLSRRLACQTPQAPWHTKQSLLEPITALNAGPAQ